MDVREQLTRSVEATEPGDPQHGRELFDRGRRRRTRQRALMVGGGAASVALVAVLAWPALDLGDGSPGPVIDEVAGPAETGTDDEPTPPPIDLPDPTIPRGDGDADAGGDGDGDPDASEADDEPDATTTPPPAAVGGDASTEDRERAHAGPADLVITDVRIGVHDGFDRVTVELSGDGDVGWFTELGDRAIEHGRGDEFDVAGDAVLTVFATMLAFPGDLDEGTPRWDEQRLRAPAGAQVLTEVVSAGWFEGQHQLFLGLTEPVPYRIGRLDGPERIVIDLLHPR